MMDIVCRASAIPSVERILLFVQLRKRRLDKSGGRSDECCYPHPEYGTGATCRDCRNHSDKIAHSHTRSGGDDQCLKCGQAVLMFFFRQKRLYHIRKKSQRQKFRSYCEIDSGRNQKKYQQRDSKTASSGQRNRNQISPQ